MPMQDALRIRLNTIKPRCMSHGAILEMVVYEEIKVTKTIYENKKTYSLYLRPLEFLCP